MTQRIDVRAALLGLLVLVLAAGGYAGQAPMARAAVPAPLQLTYITGCAPDADNTWRVRNPNATPVAVTWANSAGTQSGAFDAPTGDSFFSTPRGAETMVLRFPGGQTTKASGTDIPATDPVCAPPPSELDVLVTDPSLDPLMQALAAVVQLDLDADPATADSPALQLATLGQGGQMTIEGCTATVPAPGSLTDALDALAHLGYNAGTAPALSGPDCDLDVVTSYDPAIFGVTLP